MYEQLLTSRWESCLHNFEFSFGPVMKCSKCGASTIASFGGESKPILPPIGVIVESAKFEAMQQQKPEGV